MYRKYKYQSRSGRKQSNSHKSKVKNNESDEDSDKSQQNIKNDSKKSKETKIEYHFHNYHVASPTFSHDFYSKNQGCNEYCDYVQCPQSYVECINQKRCNTYNACNPYYSNVCGGISQLQNRCNYNDANSCNPYYNNVYSFSKIQNRCNLSPAPVITTPRQIMNAGFMQIQGMPSRNFY